MDLNDIYKNILSKDEIIENGDLFKSYKYACIKIDRNIRGIIKPKQTSNISEIIKIANNNDIKIYPISNGMNWGYGAKNPAEDNNIILDLSEFNRILEIDKKLGYVVVEPGVSQQQLHEYLEENDIKFVVDPSGSSPYASILGNAIERGFGIGEYNDHFSSVCGMEIVLADGKILETGFSHFKNSKAKHVFKYGIGPYMDGLFSQSNLGVVTKIGFWLAPKQEYKEAFYFKFENENLDELIPSLRKLKLTETVSSPINLLSRNRALTLVTKCPKTNSGKFEASDEVLADLARQNNLSIWNCTGCIYGSKKIVKAKKKVIKRELKNKTNQLVFVNEGMLKFGEKYSKILYLPVKFLTGLNIKKLLGIIRGSFDILGGEPSEVSMKTPYWRNEREIPKNKFIDPGKDNCGIYWFSPVFPLLEDCINEGYNLCQEVFNKYEFEFAPTFTLSSGRTVESTIPLLFNRDDEEETKRAEECYVELINEMKKLGYYPYRTGVTSWNFILDENDTFWDVTSSIKNALDPKNTISPKRYNKY